MVLVYQPPFLFILPLYVFWSFYFSDFINSATRISSHTSFTWEAKDISANNTESKNKGEAKISGVNELKSIRKWQKDRWGGGQITICSSKSDSYFDYSISEPSGRNCKEKLTDRFHLFTFVQRQKVVSHYAYRHRRASNSTCLPIKYFTPSSKNKNKRRMLLG